MYEISFLTGMILTVACWFLVRGLICLKSKKIDWKYEAKQLFFLVNLMVIVRMTFYPFAMVDGKVQPLIFEPAAIFPLRVNLIPFVNMLQFDTKFDLLINLIGNSTMFIPTGIMLAVLIACLFVYLYFRSKTGIAITAAGSNPTFARASGIDVDKMRVKAMGLSTVLGAIGIIVYTQGFGFLQAYTAPLNMGFICVASVLIGGATTTRATIMNVIIGTFLYQGLVIFTPPVSNHLLAGTDISDTMRQIIQNGVILYALAQAKGGSD